MSIRRRWQQEYKEKCQPVLFKNVQGVRNGNEHERKRKRKRWERKKRKTERKRNVMNITLYKKSKYEKSFKPSAENENGTI